MYASETNYFVNEDIHLRKEFRILMTSIKQNVVDNPFIERFDSNKWIKKNKYTMLKSYQLFVGNYFNPNTPYTRLLMKWETGTGKTIGALSIAMEYIRLFRELNENIQFRGSVFILGFTEEIFKRELLKFTQFGFISAKEYTQLNFLHDQSLAGNVSAGDQYKELMSRYKHRLTSRKGNGFFRFYGYKAIANRIFISKKPVTTMSREEIIAKINSGEIKLNTDVLDEFANSLIICDEIHNLYNSVEKNNWGISIETILNYNPSCRGLFLTATPLNNSATEVVDLLNLLLPRSLYPVVTIGDFFENGILTKKGEEKIQTLMRGRISFVRDVNPEKFASKEIVGEKIPGIELLRFIRCEMSEFHYKTYKEFFSGTLSVDSIYLNDICLPDPTIKDSYNAKGLFQTREIREKYSEADADWKQKYQLTLRHDEITGDALAISAKLPVISAKYTEMVRHIINDLKSAAGKTFIYHNSKQISGVFFIYEVLRANGFIDSDEPESDETLCVFCGERKKSHSGKQLNIIRGGSGIQSHSHEKYVDILFKNIKVMTYEPRKDYNLVDIGDFYPLNDNCVKNFIKAAEPRFVFYIGRDDASAQKYLSELGFFATENNDMIIYDAVKGGAQYDHEKMEPVQLKDQHIYQPARMIMLHGEMEKNDVNRLLEQFNKSSNTNGNRITILIGSKFMKESYTLVAVRNLFVMSRPDNISILYQIIGRAVRDRVHELLHPDQRHVVIKLFTSAIPGKKETSYEESKYKEKVESNKIVRNIERIMHESAIDALINYDMIWQKEGDMLDIEKYKSNTCARPYMNCGTSREVIKESTFWAYHTKFEVEYLKYMIKVCFISYSPVWKYVDLWKFVLDPPFSVTINTKLIDQALFNIALDSLVYKDNHERFKPLFMDEEIIHIESQYYTIIHLGDFYILANYDVENKDVDIDVESYNRITHVSKGKLYSVKDYIAHDIECNYKNKHDRFIMKWAPIDFKNMKMAIYNFGIEFHLHFIEDVIKYVYDYYAGRPKNKNLVFYMKILQYYSLFNLIIYANTVKEQYRGTYANLVTVAKNINNLAEIVNEKIAVSDPTWITTGMHKKLDKMLALKAGGKVPANFLPVGHLMGNIVRIYSGEWKSDPEYHKLNVDYAENDIIIGYEERAENDYDVKFKIRSPIHHIKKFNDMRKVERGIVCSTKNRDFLTNLCKKLEVQYNNRDSTYDLCSRIKMELLRREVKAREKNGKVRWFYMFYEEKPDSQN